MFYSVFNIPYIILSFGSFLANQSYGHELILTIDSVKHIKGVMMIALYNNEENYNNNSMATATQKITVTDKIIIYKFNEDLPPTYYAIKLYQDENENGKLDTNFLGIPVEGYGFSNNGGRFGQPQFNDTKFMLDKDQQIVIHLR